MTTEKDEELQLDDLTMNPKASISTLMTTLRALSQKDSSAKKSLTTEKYRKKITPSEKGKRKNDYRAKGVNWLLTFPQCSISKEEAISKITGKEDLLVKAVIAGQEKHADGNPHLHIIVCLEKRLETRKADYWDFVGSKHGDYRVIKYPKKAYDYVTKEDLEPTIFGTIPSVFLGLKTLKSDQCAQMIISGSTVANVVHTMPGYSLLNLSRILSFRSYVTNVCSTTLKWSQESKTTYTGTDTSTAFIVDWLIGNLFTERPFKAKQLWIYGPPNTLKTSLLIRLMEFCRAYQVPLEEEFYDSYDDLAYDVIFLDEYKSQKTIQFLNRFIQGGIPITMRIKGGQIMKRVNLPVIFCSNYSISDCYKSLIGVEALKERIDEVYVHTPIDLDNIDWHLVPVVPIVVDK